MQECSITISHINSKKYYKIDRATRNLYKIDVLLKRGDDILFIEVKKSKTRNITQRASITAQVNKYRDL
jgi:Holliday junction resolvase-like predicted endonuclease